MLLWDLRDEQRPVAAVEDSHQVATTTCAWNLQDPLLLATGGADRTVKLWDRRRLTSSSGQACPVSTYQQHKRAVTCVRFAPHQSELLASSSEDGNLFLWNISKTGDTSKGQMFHHAGHRGPVTEFAWNAQPRGELVLQSTSEDLGGKEGAALQCLCVSFFWRPGFSNRKIVWRLNRLLFAEE